MGLKHLRFKYLVIGLLLSKAYGQDLSTARPKKKTAYDQQLENFRFLKMDSVILAWSEGTMLITDQNKNVKDTVYISKDSKEDDSLEQQTVRPLEDSLAESGEVSEVVTDVSEERGEFETYELLSIVGPIISVRYSYYGEGGMHPYYSAYTRIFNLRSENTESLFQLFNEQDVIDALRQDSTITSRYPSLKCGSYQACIDSLESKKYMDDQNLQCGDFRSMAESFSIADYDKGMSTVLFDLSPAGGCHFGQSFSFALKIKPRKDREKLFRKMIKDKTSYKLTRQD